MDRSKGGCVKRVAGPLSGGCASAPGTGAARVCVRGEGGHKPPRRPAVGIPFLRSGTLWPRVSLNSRAWQTDCQAAPVPLSTFRAAGWFHGLRSSDGLGGRLPALSMAVPRPGPARFERYCAMLLWGTLSTLALVALWIVVFGDRKGDKHFRDCVNYLNRNAVRNSH